MSPARLWGLDFRLVPFDVQGMRTDMHFSHGVVFVWDLVWTRVSAQLSSIAAELAASHPDVWSVVGRTGTDSFPFGATVSLGRGSPRTDPEELVVSVSAQIDGEVLRMSVDVSRGDGRVLAHGPTVEIPLRDARQNLDAVLEDWLAGAENFLRGRAAGLLSRELDRA